MRHNKRPKNNIVAQNKDHTLYKLWGGKVVTKQYLVNKMKKGRKCYDLKGAEISFVEQQDGSIFLRTIADQSSSNNLSDVPIAELSLMRPRHPRKAIQERESSRDVGGESRQKFARRKYLQIFIPVCLILITLSVFLVCWFGYKPKSEKIYGEVIGSDTLTQNPDCVVTAGTNIYYDQSNAPMSLGHDLIDLKAFSQLHEGITEFTVDGTIDFGFLVDFDMDFNLYGIHNAQMQWSGAGRACGVIIGNTTRPPASTVYSGDLYIDSSMTFNISSNDNYVYGVEFEYCANCSIVNNGIFSLSSSTNAKGIYFLGTVNNSSITINGTFNISVANGEANGVDVHSAISDNSYITINGVFTISSTSASADAIGVYFYGNINNSNIIINGVFIISSNDNAYGIRTTILTEANLTIGGVFKIYGNGNVWCTYVGSIISSSSALKMQGAFTICSNTGAATGIYTGPGVMAGSIIFNSIFIISSNSSNVSGIAWNSVSGGNVTINNGAFLLYADSSDSNAVCSLGKDNGNASIYGTLTIDNSQFFSNKVDSSNLFTGSGTFTGSYLWNGATVDSTHASVSDERLALKTINDGKNRSSFSTNVIDVDGRNNASKKTFNTIYKNILKNYVNSDNCPTIVKPWLKDIIKKIPV